MHVNALAMICQRPISRTSIRQSVKSSPKQVSVSLTVAMSPMMSVEITSAA
ncbi:MAG: hypothetical protein V4516_15690 [Pseudomonadota bacterium]